MLDDHLGRHRYLTGHRLTEADWRLFTTLLRFDVVYVVHFKCNLRRIADYPNLSGYLRDLYQVRAHRFLSFRTSIRPVLFGLKDLIRKL